jgi:hypothetical protein
MYITVTFLYGPVIPQSNLKDKKMTQHAFASEAAIQQFTQTITQLRAMNRQAAEQGLVFSPKDDGGLQWELNPMTVDELLSYHRDATPTMVQAAAAGWSVSELMRYHEAMVKAVAESQEEATTYTLLAQTCETLLRDQL